MKRLAIVLGVALVTSGLIFAGYCVAEAEIGHAHGSCPLSQSAALRAW